MKESYDTGFGHAVNRAVLGDGKDLADILLSDMPLGRGEKALLAAFINGELRRPRGRQVIGVGNTRVVSIVARYRELKKSRMQEKIAVYEVAKEFGVTASSVRNWNRLTREREGLLNPPLGI